MQVEFRGVKVAKFRTDQGTEMTVTPEPHVVLEVEADYSGGVVHTLEDADKIATEQLNFGQAFDAMLNGHWIRRRCWMDNHHMVVRTSSSKRPWLFNPSEDRGGNSAWVMAWCPTSSDLIAGDWERVRR